MVFKFNLFGVILIALLAGCGAPPTRIVPPTPQSVNVFLLPSLRQLSSAVTTCAASMPEIVLFLNEVPAGAMDFRSPGLSLWLGDKPDEASFASPLMQEEIGVVANPENPIEGIELIELKAIFSGQTGNWKEIAGVDSQISVWVYPPENEVQRFITTRLLESDAISSLAHLAPDPEAMIEAIAADPASIGFLPLSWRTSSVKILPIIDVDQTNTIMPVLVLADREPQGGEREFVACLQNHSR